MYILYIQPECHSIEYTTTIHLSPIPLHPHTHTHTHTVCTITSYYVFTCTYVRTYVCRNVNSNQIYIHTYVHVPPLFEVIFQLLLWQSPFHLAMQCKQTMYRLRTYMYIHTHECIHRCQLGTINKYSDISVSDHLRYSHHIHIHTYIRTYVGMLGDIL